MVNLKDVCFKNSVAFTRKNMAELELLVIREQLHVI